MLLWGASNENLPKKSWIGPGCRRSAPMIRLVFKMDASHVCLQLKMFSIVTYALNHTSSNTEKVSFPFHSFAKLLMKPEIVSAAKCVGPVALSPGWVALIGSHTAVGVGAGWQELLTWISAGRAVGVLLPTLFRINSHRLVRFECECCELQVQKVLHLKINLQLMFPDQTGSFRQVLFEVFSSDPKLPLLLFAWVSSLSGSELWWGSVCVRVLSYALHESGWMGKCRRDAMMCVASVRRRSGDSTSVNAYLCVF